MSGATEDREAVPAASLGVETRRFGRSALVYLVPTLLVRGISFLLAPLYVHAMEPGDFAVVAVANAIIAVLGIVFSLALHGCIPRLFFEYRPEEQRAFFGTLLSISLVVPLVILGMLLLLGNLGYLEIFETVHFHPHLELVLWTAYFGVFLPLPMSVYTAREQPAKVAALSMTSALAQLLLTILLVGWMRQGAVGALRATLISTALSGVLSIVLMARMSTFRASLPGARAALAYSLPLVPHLAANWALAVSDRLVLDRYVPAADVGRYSLGYMFSLVLTLVASSVGSALAPMANRQLKEPALAKNVPPLGTYAMLITVGFGLAIALTAREVLAIIAPRTYADAAAVVPWVVLGAVFQGVYSVWSIGTWFSMKTKLVPLITLVSAALNIGANIVFVPRYGVMAAAVSTAGAYAVSALMHGWLAETLHPIAWEYRRWLAMLGLGLACYGIGMIATAPNVVVSLVLKALVALVGFPVSLVLTGVFSREETSSALAFFRRKRARA